jgi:hypothetical protein
MVAVTAFWAVGVGHAPRAVSEGATVDVLDAVAEADAEAVRLAEAEAEEEADVDAEAEAEGDADEMGEADGDAPVVAFSVQLLLIALSQEFCFASPAPVFRHLSLPALTR